MNNAIRISRAGMCRVLLTSALLLAPPVSLSLAAEDAFVCLDESQEVCDQKNKNMELFIKGRDAFDQGRESGNLGEARGYAAELIKRGDAEHGNALMKFIYLQLGQGVHKNLVEAYRWVASDIAAGVTYKRLDLQRLLGQLTARMTPEQLNEAKR